MSTRPRAWLIRRFADPAAEFVFNLHPAAIPPGDTPIDMRGARGPSLARHSRGPVRKGTPVVFMICQLCTRQ